MQTIYSFRKADEHYKLIADRKLTRIIICRSPFGGWTVVEQHDGFGEEHGLATGYTLPEAKRVAVEVHKSLNKETA